MVGPGEDCVDMVLPAVGIFDDEEKLPNDVGRPLAVTFESERNSGRCTAWRNRAAHTRHRS